MKNSRRNFLTAAATAGAGLSLLPRTASAFPMSNDEVRLGFIGCGGRGGEHANMFSKLSGAKIVGLCDPDPANSNRLKEAYAKNAKTYLDIRELVEDKDIDAVVVAACNHWHCLAAIWAMEAGKDVYVEKPLSHSQWEGEQTIKAARKYNRICQVGTQQRSDPMQAEIKKFLHEEKAIGELVSARVNRFGVRGSIGKRSTPLKPDPRIDYNLWLGPAQDLPIMREKFHYDWHWDFNTGSGEMGNWGVHVLDDVRNNVFLDKVALPKRIFGGGGRVVWNDAGESPNVHFVYFDTGSIPVVIGLSNLPESSTSNKTPKVPGPSSGYIAYGEGGRLEGQRGQAVAFDRDGKEIKRFKGNGGGSDHHKNFLEAVRARNPKLLNTDVQVGHDSTGWCNLANIAYQSAKDYNDSEAQSLDIPEWKALLEEMKSHLKSHSLEMDKAGLRLSQMLHIDQNTQRFVGDGSDDANVFIKRQYRAPFVVPEM